MIIPPINPIPVPANPIGAISSDLQNISSIFNSIERICVSNNMCAVELAKIHCVTNLICKKIEMKCAFDILQILQQYNYAKIILTTKALKNETKEELLSKIIEVIQKK